MDIMDLIGEATEYDKKLALEERKPKSWCKSVSAFANTLGGALIFGISNEDEIIGVVNPSSDAEKISEIIKNRLNPIPEFKLRFHKTEDEKDLVSFGIVNEEGCLTNAGALLVDDSPIRWSRLFCTRWNGLNKSGGTVDALDDAEYTGSVISLIENGEAFIKRNAKKMWKKTPNSRIEMPEYVERSYHEALVNALAHRDYLVNGSEVHIDIYDDRMEIYSPGGMPDGSLIQERDPLSVPSTRRNPVLADVFNRLGYMERKGSGFEKIISGYEFQVNYSEEKKPSFRSDRYQFTVIMPNLNYGDEINSKASNEALDEALEMRLLNLLKEQPELTQKEMIVMLDTSRATLQRLMKGLENAQRIERKGGKRYGYWEVKE
jgi:predicted HTH transcriptional regulator